jgi:hypothetical protein
MQDLRSDHPFHSDLRPTDTTTASSTQAPTHAAMPEHHSAPASAKRADSPTDSTKIVTELWRPDSVLAAKRIWAIGFEVASPAEHVSVESATYCWCCCCYCYVIIVGDVVFLSYLC